MSREGRQDLYRLAALLSELQRILNPLPRGSGGDFRVEMVPPPPLPPTGIPGLAAGPPAGRAPARTAAEWASLAPGRPPPRAPAPLPPWIEPPPPPVVDPGAAAPDRPEQETREGTGGSTAARGTGSVTSASVSPVPAPPPSPDRGGPVSPPLPPDDRTASRPARMAPPAVRSATPAETAAAPARRIGTGPGIAGMRTAPPLPGTVREIAGAAPSAAVARPAHPVAPALRESAAPPAATAAAGDRLRDRFLAPVRLPREPAPAMSAAIRVPPPELSVARRAGTAASGDRPGQPAPSPQAWAYPAPVAGAPIMIEVPRLDTPTADAPADVSPGEPPPVEAVDGEIEETVMLPVAETPGTRLLIRRGRILGNIPRELRNAARDRLARRFVPRLALRLP